LNISCIYWSRLIPCCRMWFFRYQSQKNGYQVLECIKSNEQLRNIPVVILSTSSWKKDIDMARELGAYTFLTKSYDSTDFLNQIISLGLFSASAKNGDHAS